MKFIFNFIFFGLLFFIIWKFLPDSFNTLVGWVNSLYEALHNLVLWLLEKAGALKDGVGTSPRPGE